MMSTASADMRFLRSCARRFEEGHVYKWQRLFTRPSQEEAREIREEIEEVRDKVAHDFSLEHFHRYEQLLASLRGFGGEHLTLEDPNATLGSLGLRPFPNRERDGFTLICARPAAADGALAMRLCHARFLVCRHRYSRRRPSARILPRFSPQTTSGRATQSSWS